MQLDCQARLAAAGYAQYEISAYARPGRQCRHNLNYWRFGDYLGIGAGAHGKVTVAGQVDPHREAAARRASTCGWRPQRRPRSASRVPVVELPFEFMLNALRLDEGFTLADFERDDRSCRRQRSSPGSAS